MSSNKFNISPSELPTSNPQTIGVDKISAWNESVLNIEQYMAFIFAGIVLMFLTQMVIIVQMKKQDQIEIFDGEGWFT